MLTSQVQTIQQQIENENSRHSKEIARLKSLLEEAKNTARDKKARDKRNREIQANSEMQNQASQINTYTQRSAWENFGGGNCKNKELITNLKELVENSTKIEDFI